MGTSRTNGISMQINLHQTDDNQFTKYSEYSVTIKNKEYTSNIIVTNSNIIEFPKITIEQITLEYLGEVMDFAPDLIIFGTGNRIKYPNLKLISTLQCKGIGVEVMSIQALCRTFNFLISEDRKIAGILLFT
jgi:uncharacterized protein